MCGIVGYTGDRSAIDLVIDGLRRLEYRGYESAGVALTGKEGEALVVEKKAGKLGNLEAALDDRFGGSKSGIGHTRWATHGGPTDTNAHPHLSNDGKLAVIHNGIIENYVELKAELLSRGHKFTSETDTESVAHLLSDAVIDSKGDLADAMRKVCKRLRGSFTLLAVHADNPKVIVGARRNSPLVVGVGNGENFLASDVSAFISSTKQAMELGQDQVVTVTPESVTVTDLDVSLPWYHGMGFLDVDDHIIDDGSFVGLTGVTEVSGRASRLRLPDENCEVVLVQWSTPRSHGRHPVPANQAGWYRTAVCVDDTRASYDEFLQLGWTFEREPREVELEGTKVPDMWICFLNDPDGVPFEFVQRPRSAFRPERPAS